jgi:hypothetical protein
MKEAQMFVLANNKNVACVENSGSRCVPKTEWVTKESLYECLGTIGFILWTAIKVLFMVLAWILAFIWISDLLSSHSNKDY